MLPAEYLPLALRTEPTGEDYANVLARLSPVSDPTKPFLLRDLEAALRNFIEAASWLDRVKKAALYGREQHWTIEEREASAPSNVGSPSPLTIREATAALTDIRTMRVMHGVVGLATESGELAEALWETLFNRGDLDVVNIAEELGDGDWYGAILLDAIGGTRAGVMERNIEKLRARFPDKYSDAAANDRDLAGERAVLEGVSPVAARTIGLALEAGVTPSEDFEEPRAASVHPVESPERGTPSDLSDLAARASGALTVDMADAVGVTAPPARYNRDGQREAIDLIRDLLGDAGFFSYCVGQVVRYSYRTGAKGPAAEDEAKSGFYRTMALHIQSGGILPDPRAYRAEFAPYVRHPYPDFLHGLVGGSPAGQVAVLNPTE